MHPVDLADALLAVLGAVEHRGAGLKATGVDADVGELAQVRVAHDLEGEGREGLVIARLALDGLVLVAGLVALDGRDVERRRKVGDHGVEHGLNALVLEGRAGEHGGELVGEGRAANAGLDLLDGELLALKELLHDGVVGLGQGLEELLAPLGGLTGHVGGDVLDDVVLALLGLSAPGERTHGHEVDDSEEVGLGTDGELEDERRGAKAILDHVDAHVEVGAGAVELVDEADPGDVVAVRLTPDGLGLGLDARDPVEDGNRAVKHTQGALHLDGEVDVAGRVDDVDRVALPLARRGCGSDRDAALLLLLHPVHRGCAFVDLTDLVVDAGVEEDALGGRGLARVDMRHDPDVADLGEVELGRGGHP